MSASDLVYKSEVNKETYLQALLRIDYIIHASDWSAVEKVAAVSGIVRLVNALSDIWEPETEAHDEADDT